MLGAFAGWLGRHAVLYVLLVGAIAFYTFAWPSLSAAWRNGTFGRETMSRVELARELEEWRAEAAADLEASASRIERLSTSGVADELERRRKALADLRGQLKGSGSWLDAIRPTAILRRKRLQIRAVVLEQEIALLEAASGRRQASDVLVRIGRIPTPHEIAEAQGQCQTANRQVREFNALPMIERRLRNILRDEASVLTRNARQRCGEARNAVARRRDGLAAKARLAQAEAAYDAVRRRAEGALAKVSSADFGQTVRDILWKAALALLAILLMPYLIRLLFYAVLAPLAERRPAIRLRVPGGAGAPIPPVDRSTTSVALRLEPGEELLVRQAYLQSTGLGGRKATRWLLDWRHPFASLASGLVFLVRIRDTDEATTISAVRDPLAEVAVLSVPEGGACVLQPRALAAVAQPIGRPLRITSHWRLGSLNAWLTLQLRYLVFHGPARLVLKGGRGVRVERAERGRVFGPAQLVGFSADLAYSVTRTETFWPYFLGGESLLKDKVQAGEGVLIVEESPLGGGRGEPTRKGLEGAMDAFLKVFGF